MFHLDRLTKVILSLLVIGVWGLLLKPLIYVPQASAQTTAPVNTPDVKSQVIRARSIILVDEAGRDRMFFGPHPDTTKDGKRINPSFGMTINDANGFERFGLGLKENGTMSMGFDAPPGKGDDRNRERISFIADSQGGAEIRFLNRKTLVPGRIRLGEDDKLYLEFLDVQMDKKKVIRQKIGMNGKKTFTESLK